MYQQRRLAPLISILTIGLSSCIGSISQMGSIRQIDEHETYRGPLLVAVAPVQGPTRHLNDWMAHHQLQLRLADQFGASGVFSGVQAIDSVSAPNEADIILEPTLLTDGPDPFHHDELALRLRAIRKTTGVTELDREYREPCDNCQAGFLSSASLRKLTERMNSDLRRKFGRRGID